MRPVGRAVPPSVRGDDFPRRRAHDDWSLTDRLRIIPRLTAFTLARLTRNSRRVTLTQPYNPHSVAAAQPRGLVQQGLSALSLRWCSRRSSWQCG